MRSPVPAMVAILLAVSPALGAEPPVPVDWQTPAERSDFAATATYDEALALIRHVAERVPEVRLSFYGASGQGRALPVVVVSREKAFTPALAAGLDKPVVMVQNSIHAGEPDGTDACLLLLRDWALGRRRELLDDATLLILPIYNVDGHERVSPYNRANQLGPSENLGFRTNATGLDLNRDFVKVVSPEARALVALFNAWRPDLHVDVHVTDGSDHDWVLTSTWAEAPQAPEAVDAWLRDRMPSILAATERDGHRCGPYVELTDRNDPTRGFSSWVGGARYATGYFPLRNRPSVLLEMHAYKPYRPRVAAVLDFLVGLLTDLGSSGRSLRAAVRAADEQTVALGAAGAAPSTDVLAFEESKDADRIAFPVYDWFLAPSTVSGRPLLRFRRGQVHEITVPWVHRVVAAVTVARPRGYLVLPGWRQIEDRLAVHGLRVERLLRETDLEVETIHVSEPRFAPATYQGLTRVEARVERRSERRRLPAGSLWIPADQPDFEVAAQLLEPDAPDSLFAWGLLSTVLEGKEYVGPQRLEELAAAMLEDPAVAAAWRLALEDERFASNPRARTMWWTERTPYYAVQEVGLLPVVRLMTAAALDTAPWAVGTTAFSGVGR